MAVCELDLKLDEFLDLSFYEWTLYIERNRRKNEKELLHVEIGWDYTRKIIAAIWNVQLEPAKRLEPHEIIKLSWDKVEEPKTVEEAEKEGAEYFKDLKRKLGGTIKPKDGK